MDTDRNLLFGVLALRADLLDKDRFAEACSAWAARQKTPLADLLVGRGWLTAEQRGRVEVLLDRELANRQGDGDAVRPEVTTDYVRQSLAATTDSENLQSLDGSSAPPTPGLVLLSTSGHGSELRDRYTLTRLHATGGIGRVWLARDPRLGRDVALKELRPERAGRPEAWARFLREAQITGQLEHPGIVPIYEVGQRPDDQAPFYTMRFVRGRTLAEAAAAYHARLGRNEARPSDLRELVVAFVGVCNAVAYAHSRGVLHRDLKPPNVVLGDFGEVIVLDWGLARLTGQAGPDDNPAGPQVESGAGVEATAEGRVLGTPGYMAPEQAEGRPDRLGPATDVYGLGAILYEILTGRPPFTGTITLEILRRVAHEPPAPPRSLSAGVPRPLEAVCLKALEKTPEQRYGTAKELATEVQQWLADEPVAAYREPLTVRAGRWVKHHRLLVTSIAAAVLVAVAGLGVVLVLQARSNRELAAANRQLSEANEREQARFDLALDAVRAFHTGVSHDVLLKQPQFKDLRDRLLGEAAGFYRKVEAQTAGRDDARSRLALARAYFDLAYLTDLIGSKEDALAAHERALAYRIRLADDDPADKGLQIALAGNYTAVGKSQVVTGKPAAALASYEAGLAIRQRLADAEPAAAARQSDLAWSHNDIGNMLAQLGRPAEARAAFEKARAIYVKLADAHPDVAEYRSDAAGCDHNIGVILKAAGDLPAALAAFESARAVQRALVDTQPPGEAQYQVYLANSEQTVGSTLLKMRMPAAALAAFERARAVRQKLVDAHPAVTAYQAALANIHGNIGILLLQMEKPGEALRELEAARALSQKVADASPGVPRIQNDLATGYTETAEVLRILRRTDEARASYERAIAIREGLVRAQPEVAMYRSHLAYSLKRMARAIALNSVKLGGLGQAA
jgi:serine/threonine-protein kinase